MHARLARAELVALRMHAHASYYVHIQIRMHARTRLARAELRGFACKCTRLINCMHACTRLARAELVALRELREHRADARVQPALGERRRERRLVRAERL